MIAEFPNRVIDLCLQAFVVNLLDIRLQIAYGVFVKRIIDIRIEVVAVVDVYDVGAAFFGIA